MRQVISIFAMFYAILAFSQNNYRIIYRLDYRPHKGADLAEHDYYNLDIYPIEKKSAFYNYSFYKNDSVMAHFKTLSDRNGGVDINLDALPKPKLAKTVIQEGREMFALEMLDGDSFKFPENAPSWKILNETKKIKNWLATKAETNYKGRKWMAWFTSEVPISEGPYKFKGLPGLVLEVADEGNNYNFTLESLLKNSEKYYLPKIYAKAIPTTRAKFDKILQDYKNDPAAKLRKGTIVDESGNIFNINGGFSKNFIDQVVQERKSAFLKNNNPIDLEN